MEENHISVSVKDRCIYCEKRWISGLSHSSADNLASSGWINVWDQLLVELMRLNRRPGPREVLMSLWWRHWNESCSDGTSSFVSLTVITACSSGRLTHSVNRFSEPAKIEVIFLKIMSVWRANVSVVTNCRGHLLHIWDVYPFSMTVEDHSHLLHSSVRLMRTHRLLTSNIVLFTVAWLTLKFHL